MTHRARKCNAGWLELETLLLIAGLSLCAIMVFLVYHKETVEMPNAFAAWEKQTGNEKNLTYEEWRALMRANETTNVILIPR